MRRSFLCNLVVFVGVFVATLLFAGACGGTKKDAKEATASVADQPTTSKEDGMNPCEGTPLSDDNGNSEDGTTPDPCMGTAAEPAPPENGVIFRLRNTSDKELVFSLDKGWQPILFAFSGKPPKAKSLLMFPTHCTASCGTQADSRCPYCPEPVKVRDIKKAEKREIVAPGAFIDVPWNGEAYVYQKTKGKRRARTVRCQCYNKRSPEPAVYTVRACGLRLTDSAKHSSKYQCESTEMSLPDQTGQIIEIEFASP